MLPGAPAAPGGTGAPPGRAPGVPGAPGGGGVVAPAPRRGGGVALLVAASAMSPAWGGSGRSGGAVPAGGVGTPGGGVPGAPPGPCG
ncbi:hypothetical protein FHS32_006296 [Streptomyces albaduncus]|uniref:Uncharacterized protein n=1 Tax=Streptomyces griseoloalbus TaxID=67303 RepID=A0A7W8BXH1_9ACTN|nr:hypothetical protein [Streptomyces albaduncus]